MEFTNGVVAAVYFNCCNYKGGYFHNSDDVYECLVDNGIDELLAMDAQGWTELAGVDEAYNEDEFDIYIVDLGGQVK